jgi:hypothetical protein
MIYPNEQLVASKLPALWRDRGLVEYRLNALLPLRLKELWHLDARIYPRVQACNDWNGPVDRLDQRFRWQSCGLERTL